MNYFTVYWVYGGRCRVVIDGVEELQPVSARWHVPQADTSKSRTDILDQIGEQIHAVDLRQDAEIGVASVISAGFAEKNVIQLGEPENERPIPEGRAKVRLDLFYQGPDEFDALFAFEDRLDDELQDAQVGYVEGNDCGGGEFRLFCQGPRKKPLREAIERIASQTSLTWRIGR